MSRLLHSLPRAAGGRKMDSIVREVVSRSGVQPRLPESPTQRVGVDAEDAELERILASLRTNIKIVGIGGGGCNTIDRLVESGIVGAELFAANTDAQHLLIIRSPHKLLLGRRVTRGLGAGALPQVGEESAREAPDELRSVVQGADMVFITCGLGGGTGTRSEEHTSELQSPCNLVCRLLLEQKKSTTRFARSHYGGHSAARGHGRERGERTAARPDLQPRVSVSHQLYACAIQTARHHLQRQT